MRLGSHTVIFLIIVILLILNLPSIYVAGKFCVVKISKNHRSQSQLMTYNFEGSIAYNRRLELEGFQFNRFLETVTRWSIE